MKKLTQKFFNNIVFKLYKLFNYIAAESVNPLSACYKTYSLRLATYLFRAVTCSGHGGLTRYKLVSGYLIRIVMGAKVLELPPARIPRWMLTFVRRARGSHLESLFAVSVLSLHRLVVLKPQYDIATITSGFGGDLLTYNRLYGKYERPVAANLGRFAKAEKIAPFSFRWSRSGSSGPNGSPAFDKTFEDAYALSGTPLLKEIFKLFETLPVKNKAMWGTALLTLTKRVREYSPGLKGREPLHSRLAFLSDKAGKTRVVAIVDILSQTLLKPVHDHLNRILRRIPMDGTFDQDKQRERVRKWTAERKFCASIDLSACTDRFPVAFQASALVNAGILTPLQARGWMNVITKRDFSFTPNLRKGRKRIRHSYRVKYKVGQPMGAYSSWPVMAFSHHVLVQLSYKVAFPESGKIFTRYALLGDDLVIQDAKVAQTYKEIIASLGMPYSPSKSFEGEGMAEFAKSLFRHGEDLKPFPLSLLVTKKNTIVSDVIALVTELSARRFRINFADLLKLWSSDYRMKRVATLAILSPSSDKRCLGGFPIHQEGFGTFNAYLLSRRVAYFLKEETLKEQITMWYRKSLASTRIMLGMPSVYDQITLENAEKYPVRILDSRADPLAEILVGDGWVAYDSSAWPDGLPKDVKRTLIPGPSWKKDIDDVILRSSLLTMNRFVPDYFWPSCGQRRWR